MGRWGRKTLELIPMIHLDTTAGSARKKAITPAQIAARKGESYLLALNDAISQ